MIRTIRPSLLKKTRSRNTCRKQGTGLEPRLLLVVSARFPKCFRSASILRTMALPSRCSKQQQLSMTDRSVDLLLRYVQCLQVNNSTLSFSQEIGVLISRLHVVPWMLLPSAGYVPYCTQHSRGDSVPTTGSCDTVACQLIVLRIPLFRIRSLVAISNTHRSLRPLMVGVGRIRCPRSRLRTRDYPSCFNARVFPIQ
jgi:hypothetical protein